MKNKVKVILASSGILAIAALTFQLLSPETPSPQGYQATEEDLAYLQKKYEKKINKPKRYDKPKEAMQYYVDQRKPVGATNIPVERYEMARQHISDLPRINSSQNLQFPSANQAQMFGVDPATTTPNFNSWTALGPGNVGGRTRTLAINPTTPDIMYTAGVAGGIWKTTDGGASWTPLDDLMNNMAVTTIVIDPNNHDTVYAGTGEGFFNGDAVRGDGIFKSTDGGSSWTHLSATSGNANFHYVNKLAVSKNDSNRVYAATREGIFRSINSGTTWSQLKTKASVSDSIGCLDIQIRTDQNPDVLIAACGSFQRGSIHRSADGGDNWTEVLAETNMGRSSLAIAPSNQNTMYALTASNASGNYRHGLHAVFKSTDGGATWAATVRNNDSNKLNTILLSNPVFAYLSDCGFGSSNQFFNQGWYDNIIAVDPANENIVWAGGIDLFRSDDGGANWGVASKWWGGKTNPKYTHADQHGIYFHPDYNGTTNKTAFFSHDGGLSKTTDARATVDTSEDAACNLADSGFTFTSLNNNYAVTQFYHGLAYPDGATFFGGTQDNGTNRGTTAGGVTWAEILGGDGGYVAIDPSDTNIVFAETQNRDFRKSTDGGTNFSSAVTGITESTNNYDFITPFVMDPNNPQNLWIGGSTLWKTTDQAANWTQASATDMSSTSITAWAVANGDSNYVAAGNSSGDVFYTTDAGNANSTTTWTSSQPVNGVVSSLIYDPNNKTVVYATYSTFGVDHIWKSTDSGAIWNAIDKRDQTNGIPDIPVHTLAIDPDDSNKLFAGTDLGIFVSSDGGTTWAVENTGFTNTVVENLHLLTINGAKHLFAFTHGRGAWRTTLASTTTDTTPPTVTVNIVDTTLSDSDNSSNVTFTFSEAVTGFTEADLTVVGGSLSNFSFTDNSTSGSVTFTASDDSTTTGSVTVAADSYTDAAGNNGATGNDTVTVDTSNPTVTVDIVDSTLSDSDNSSNVTFTFSEAVTGFTDADLTAVGGTLSNFSLTDNNTSGSVTFTANDNSTTTGSVTVAANSYTDAAGNNGATGNDTVSVDTINPTVTVNIVDSALSDSDNSSNVTFTFSEAVTGFTESDLTVVGGTLAAFSFTDNSTSGSVTFTASDNSTTTGSVTVAANSYTDAAGNNGATGNDTVTVDTVNPTVTVNIVDTALSDSDNSSNVTFTFSEAVTGFTDADLTVVGGTLSNFSFTDNNTSGSVTFTANDNSTTTGSVTIAADSYTDAAGNNGATGTDTISVNTVDPDTTPDAFTFTDQSSVTANSPVTSDAITVSGINTGSAISITDGEYSINDNPFTSSVGTVNSGDTIKVKHTSSSSFNAITNTTLTIGGVSDTFTSITGNDPTLNIADDDGDGTPNSEDADPNDASSASATDASGNKVQVNAETSMKLVNVESKTEASVNTTNKPDGFSIANGGIISYDVINIGGNGKTITITLTYPSVIPAGSKIYKVDANGFAEFPNATFVGNKVTLTLTDGGQGDADDVANGIIDDPVAVMQPTSTTTTGTTDTSNTSGGGGGSLHVGWLFAMFSLMLASRIRRKR